MPHPCPVFADPTTKNAANQPYAPDRLRFDATGRTPAPGSGVHGCGAVAGEDMKLASLGVSQEPPDVLTPSSVLTRVSPARPRPAALRAASGLVAALGAAVGILVLNGELDDGASAAVADCSVAGAAGATLSNTATASGSAAVRHRRRRRPVLATGRLAAFTSSGGSSFSPSPSCTCRASTSWTWTTCGPSCPCRRRGPCRRGPCRGRACRDPCPCPCRQ
jgi:hypothetical protein